MAAPAVLIAHSLNALFYQKELERYVHHHYNNQLHGAAQIGDAMVAENADSTQDYLRRLLLSQMKTHIDHHFTSTDLAVAEAEAVAATALSDKSALATDKAGGDASVTTDLPQNATNSAAAAASSLPSALSLGSASRRSIK